MPDKARRSRRPLLCGPGLRETPFSCGMGTRLPAAMQCSTGDFQSLFVIILLWAIWWEKWTPVKNPRTTFYFKGRDINLVWVSRVWGQDGLGFQVLQASGCPFVPSCHLSPASRMASCCLSSPGPSPASLAPLMAHPSGKNSSVNDFRSNPCKCALCSRLGPS